MPRHGDRTRVALCSVDGCPRRAAAKGLCLAHYKRQRAGKPLLAPGPHPGDPDGHGLYGDLDDDGETVQCHECGHRAPSLGSHIVAAHGISAREYKIAHGLPLSRGLISEAERVRMRAKAKATPAILQALEEHRDPAAASAARTAESFAATAAHRDPDLPRRNGDTGVIVESCEVCGVEWCRLPGPWSRARTCSYACSRALMTMTRPARRGTASRDSQIVHRVLRAGHSRARLAYETGLSEERIGQIIRRHVAEVGDLLPGDARWLDLLAEVVDYVALHDHDPLWALPDLDSRRLADWLDIQRRHWREGTLPGWQVRALLGAQIDPDPHDWGPWDTTICRACRGGA